MPVGRGGGQAGHLVQLKFVLLPESIPLIEHL